MSATIKCVGVVVKPNSAQAWRTACELRLWLKARGIDLVGDPLLQTERVDGLCEAGMLPVQNIEFGDDVDLVVVLGGDGTMIATTRIVGERAIPILGINYGSLGYLTEFRVEELFPAMEQIIAGDYTVDPRVALRVEHARDGETLSSNRVLNDVVINKAALARIIEIDVWLDDFYVNSFRADGLIVATPTGSTAYSLSAGGPIIYPSMEAFVITPICPFTLSNRPIVVPDTAQIQLQVKTKNEEIALTLDGQIGVQIEPGDTIRIRKSRTTFNLVEPPTRNYFDVLRDKLRWGDLPRR